MHPVLPSWLKTVVGSFLYDFDSGRKQTAETFRVVSILTNILSRLVVPATLVKFDLSSPEFISAVVQALALVNVAEV